MVSGEVIVATAVAGSMQIRPGQLQLGCGAGSLVLVVQFSQGVYPGLPLCALVDCLFPTLCFPWVRGSWLSLNNSFQEG